MASPKNSTPPLRFGAPLVRSDINLEKWNIFTTHKRKGLRVLKREMTTPEGIVIKQKVSVGLKESSETLTTAEAKIFYLLLNLWEKQGYRPDGNVYSSLHRLFNELSAATEGPQPKKTRRGNWAKSWLKDKLQHMLTIPIAFESAYKEKNGAYTNNVSFTLLSQTDVYERKLIPKDQMHFDYSRFTLHPTIVKSLLEKNVKPVRADVLLRLRKEVSVILYRHIDLVLFDKAQYERNLKDLSEDLGFGASRLDNLLHQLREACAELEGKDLSTGRIDSCRIEKTADGRDWKLVAVKGRQRPALSTADVASAAPSTDPDAAEETALLALFDGFSPEEKTKVQSAAEEIYRSKYRMGGDLTRRYALLDALREYREREAEGRKT